MTSCRMGDSAEGGPPTKPSADSSTTFDAVPEAAAQRALVVADPLWRAMSVAASAGTVIREAEDLDLLAERARGFASASRAEATRRAYRSDWQHFMAWCASHGVAALPTQPEIVAAYLTECADTRAVATLMRRVSSLVTVHREAGYVLDTWAPPLRDTLRGIRRVKGTAPRRAAALSVPLLKRVLATCGERLIDQRDRALLLVGVAGAFRRSELCSLDLGEVTISPEGLTIRLVRSKGDQEGEGVIVAIGRTPNPTCPVAAFEAWLASSGIKTGRAFRSVDRHGRLGSSVSTRAIAQIVQARAHEAGLNAKAFSGHSMRSGFCTSAAAEGVEERAIMRQSRHKSVSVMRTYIRDGERWSRNLANEIGL